MTESPQWPVEECRSCHEPIIWTLTERLKSMPVDAEPSPEGTIAMSMQGTTVHSRVVKPAHLRYGRKDLYLSHFVKCPQAGKWRSRRP